MLKPVVEHVHGGPQAGLGETAGEVPVGGHHDGGPVERAGQHPRLVAGDRQAARDAPEVSDHRRPLDRIGAPVTPAEDGRALAHVDQQAGQPGDQRGLAAAAGGQRPHADHRPREPAPGLGVPTVPPSAAARRFGIETTERPEQPAAEVPAPRRRLPPDRVVRRAARRGQHRRDLGQAAGGGPAVRLDEAAGGGPQRRARVGVGQQLGQHRGQLVLARDAAGGPVRQEELGDLGEVLHVRPEHHRLAPGGRLDHVVPADGDQAAAQEHDGGRLKQPRQLADGIEHHDVGRAGPVPGKPAAAHGREAPPGRERGHLGAALGMPRREHQQRLGPAAADLPEGVEHGRLFARMGARGDQHRPLRREPQRPAQGLAGPRVGARRRRGVELQVAGRRHPVAGRPEVDEAARRLRALGAAAVHVGEHPAEQEPRQTVARIRAVGDAPVHEHRPHPAPRAAPQQVGPQLGLDRQKQHRPHPVEHPVDGRRQVEGKIEQAVDSLEAGGHRPARRGGRRQPQRVVGIALAQPRNQRAGGLHLAHRDRVNPDRRPPRGIDAGRQAAPALPQRPDVLAAADGRVQQARGRPQGVADDGRAVQQMHRCRPLRRVEAGPPTPRGRTRFSPRRFTRSKVADGGRPPPASGRAGAQSQAAAGGAVRFAPFDRAAAP